MATEVSITLFGDTLFRRRILAMRHRARDMTPVMERLGDWWVDWIEDQFATEGRRGGTPWKKLERSTRLRRKSAHPILVQSADLLIHTTDRGNVKITDDSITLELPDHEEVKGASHQYGFYNVLAQRDVDARPWAVFTDADRALMRRTITNYLVNGRLP